MPLGWETNIKYTVESKSLSGGKSELGAGNPRASHPLYKTLIILHSGVNAIMVNIV